jgi:predicted nuclease of predicted toxin-antitoxin system
MSKTASSLRFKIDEDLPAEIAGLFTAAGCDATTVFEQKMQGSTDESLWSTVAGEGRSLVTADVGFADVRRLAARTRGNVGIVLFRAWPESRQMYLRLAGAFLETFPLNNVPGQVVTVTHDGIRAHDTRREHSLP